MPETDILKLSLKIRVLTIENEYNIGTLQYTEKTYPNIGCVANI